MATQETERFSGNENYSHWILHFVSDVPDSDEKCESFGRPSYRPGLKLSQIRISDADRESTHFPRQYGCFQLNVLIDFPWTSQRFTQVLS